MVYEQLVARGGGNVSGEEMLRVWSKAPGPDDIAAALQKDLSDEEGAALLARFDRWNSEPLNLPGTYYLQIVNWIFRENRIASGNFTALGRTIDLKDVKVADLPAGRARRRCRAGHAGACDRQPHRYATGFRCSKLRAQQPSRPVHGRADTRPCLAPDRGMAA